MRRGGGGRDAGDAAHQESLQAWVLVSGLVIAERNRPWCLDSSNTSVTQPTWAGNPGRILVSRGALFAAERYLCTNDREKPSHLSNRRSWKRFNVWGTACKHPIIALKFQMLVALLRCRFGKQGCQRRRHSVVFSRPLSVATEQDCLQKMYIATITERPFINNPE